MFNIVGNRYNFSNHIMRQALLIASQAELLGEVPVASIIVDSKTKQIISSSHNLVESKKNPLLHCEMIAINEACKTLGAKYLDNCEIYITLEPCIMCYSAISYARIPKIYFGAFDNKNGLKYLPEFLYKPDLYGGIMEAEAQELLSKFFNKIRIQNHS